MPRAKVKHKHTIFRNYVKKTGVNETARLTGFSASTISRVMNGQRPLSPELAKALALLTGRPAARILWD